ncbi:MAG: sodium-independent anion transporter [Clostridia bacterium]|nr:sodium-independent anion transporter [Clostridia bacterium]
MKKPYILPEIISALKNYSKKQCLNDIIAGIIVSIIALPLSIALALASGVDPQCGVYTAIAAGFVVSLLGGSRIQIAGPTAAFATIVAGVVAQKGMEGLFLATVIAGIVLILMGIFKLGSLIKYMPHTITVGFTGGIAVTILLGQIKGFLGITYAQGTVAIETIEKVEANIRNFSTFSPWSVAVGALCLLILIVYPKFEKRLPPSLLAVVLSALLVKFIPVLDENVLTIGDLYNIPAGLPKLDISVDLSIKGVIDVLPDAFTIAILAAVESLLSCVVADGMINQKHNSNTELVAQGLGNIASAFFGGIPATGAIARTSANAKNGGRTPIAGIVHAVMLLLMLLFLMPYAALIPMPAIAAILFMVAYNMSEWRKFVEIFKEKKLKSISVLMLTFVFTVIFDLVVAIVAGIALYLIISVVERLIKKNAN